MDLTDAQWAFLEPLFRPKRRKDGRGRPWQDTRAVLNGVLWVLRTGAPWHDLPSRYPPYHNLSSTFPTVAALRAADALAANTGRRLTRPRKARSERILHRRQLQFGEKGGSGVGPTKRGKGSKIMAIADGHGLPLAVHVASASPHETKLVEPTLERRFLAESPERMIGDRAYDSDPLGPAPPATLRRAAHRASQIRARRNRPHKMAAACVATAAVGKSSDCLLGSIIFVASSFAGNTTQRISSGWFSSLAPSSS